VEERVFLVSSWQSDRSRDSLSIATSYRIRRGRGDDLRTFEADRVTELSPGDVLLISIELPERTSQASSN
jgi:hypothetical protein